MHRNAEKFGNRIISGGKRKAAKFAEEIAKLRIIKAQRKAVKQRDKLAH